MRASLIVASFVLSSPYHSSGPTPSTGFARVSLLDQISYISDAMIELALLSRSREYVHTEFREPYFCQKTTKLVYGMRVIGKGYTAAQTLCGMLNLPPPPSKYTQHECLFLKVFRELARNQCSLQPLKQLEKMNPRGICVLR
ncbi:hypothetical protein J6590_003234 [Homalodisca vitripennis]|nr:hypothetical protein J6590_003234 [Homalodisca vitripennis]